MVHWVVRAGSAGVGLGPGEMGRLSLEWRWIGSGEHNPGLLSQADKLSRRNQSRSWGEGW